MLTLVGSIIYLVFGWFVFDLILGKYTEANTTHIEGFKKNQEEYSFLFLYISCLAYAALITYVLIFISKTQTLYEGFLRASAIGVLVAIMTDTFWYGSSNFYNNIWVMFSDILGAAISVGVLGLSIIWLNIRLDKFYGVKRER
ncbi:MAG: hypothetical protein ACXVOH_04095 [Bacteroidia bacterium]